MIYFRDDFSTEPGNCAELFIAPLIVWIRAKQHKSRGSIEATVIDIQRWSMKDEELHVAKVLLCNKSSVRMVQRLGLVN